MRSAIGYHSEGGGSEHTQTVIDPLHPWRRALLIVRDDPAVFKLHITSVPQPSIAKDGHESWFATRQKGLLDSTIVARQKGVSVNDEESIS